MKKVSTAAAPLEWKSAPTLSRKARQRWGNPVLVHQERMGQPRLSFSVSHR
jgi:hypothetical protein